MLVTGGNSGLGFEACHLLAQAGYARVLIGARSKTKGEAAAAALRQRAGGRDVFFSAVADLSTIASSRASAEQLASELSAPLDALILNAGQLSDKYTTTADGIESMLAVTAGHHILTLELLRAGKLAPDARVLIASSEGARGVEQGILDYGAAAAAADPPSLIGGLELIARGKFPDKAAFKPPISYNNSKIWPVWWVQHLKRVGPAGMTFVAVSPGFVPSGMLTNQSKDSSWLFRTCGIPLVSAMAYITGMSHSMESGAMRYVTASELGPAASGQFWASPKGKFAGKLQPQTAECAKPFVFDREHSEAAFNVLTKLTGVDLA